ncbi:MAG: hypothetical protein PHX08_21505 [Lachnospiraceae bacterium]|nr:hypothetical protein [Lachnospiraceae bacterium]
MKKRKRILAIIGVVLLTCLYLSTLFFAFFDHDKSLDLLMVSIAATFFIPVSIYAYTLIYKLNKPNDTDTPK